MKDSFIEQEKLQNSGTFSHILFMIAKKEALKSLLLVMKKFVLEDSFHLDLFLKLCAVIILNI